MYEVDVKIEIFALFKFTQNFLHSENFSKSGTYWKLNACKYFIRNFIFFLSDHHWGNSFVQTVSYLKSKENKYRETDENKLTFEWRLRLKNYALHLFARCNESIQKYSLHTNTQTYTPFSFKTFEYSTDHIKAHKTISIHNSINDIFQHFLATFVVYNSLPKDPLPVKNPKTYKIIFEKKETSWDLKCEQKQ